MECGHLRFTSLSEVKVSIRQKGACSCQFCQQSPVSSLVTLISHHCARARGSHAACIAADWQLMNKTVNKTNFRFLALICSYQNVHRGWMKALTNSLLTSLKVPNHSLHSKSLTNERDQHWMYQLAKIIQQWRRSSLRGHRGAIWSMKVMKETKFEDGNLQEAYIEMSPNDVKVPRLMTDAHTNEII